MRPCDPSHFHIDRTYPGRWTITFSNPPINMFVPATIVELGALMTDLEADPSVKVVVFQSANPDFFIAHLDGAKALNGPRRWAFGANLAAPRVHASREHRQNSRPHPPHRERVRTGLRHALRQPAKRRIRQPRSASDGPGRRRAGMAPAFGRPLART